MDTVAEGAIKLSNPTVPPYPEMILMAIKKVGEKNGLNKSAIADYIESNYAELPETHLALLTAHLTRMKESGELLLIKNNYFVPGPDAPPKRGRGRPPKPKQPMPPSAATATGGVAAAASASPRPRGRPPKPKDPLAMAVAKASSGLPRRRGRPPKAAARHSAAATAFPTAAAADSAVTGVALPSVTEAVVPVVTEADAAIPAVATMTAPIVGVKRGRGRPPKAKVAMGSVNA